MQEVNVDIAKLAIHCIEQFRECPPVSHVHSLYRRNPSWSVKAVRFKIIGYEPRQQIFSWAKEFDMVVAVTETGDGLALRVFVHDPRLRLIYGFLFEIANISADGHADIAIGSLYGVWFIEEKLPVIAILPGVKGRVPKRMVEDEEIWWSSLALAAEGRR